MTYEIVALTTIAAAIVAGISWNTLGIWTKWREDEDSSIEWSRVKKNVIIGAIIGIIAYGIQIQAGDPSVVIASINAFVIAVVGFFPLVVVADKIFNKKSE